MPFAFLKKILGGGGDPDDVPPAEERPGDRSFRARTEAFWSWFAENEQAQVLRALCHSRDTRFLGYEAADQPQA